MKGKRALLAGCLLGCLLGLTATPLGLKPVEITFFSCVTLFLYSSTCLVVFALRGWPIPRQQTDFYDFSKILVGVALSVITLGVITAASEKLSAMLFISQALAAGLAATFLLFYCGLAYSLVAFTRRSPRRGQFGNSFN